MWMLPWGIIRKKMLIIVKIIVYKGIIRGFHQYKKQRSQASLGIIEDKLDVFLGRGGATFILIILTYYVFDVEYNFSADTFNLKISFTLWTLLIFAYKEDQKLISCLYPMPLPPY